MPRRLQFSLRRLLASTTLMAAAGGIYVAASQCEAAWSSIPLGVLACTVCGAAFGYLVRLPLPGAILGFFAGISLVIYAIKTSDL